MINELFNEVFDSEYEVNLEMDDVNPWMIIAAQSGKTAA